MHSGLLTPKMRVLLKVYSTSGRDDTYRHSYWPACHILFADAGFPEVSRAGRIENGIPIGRLGSPRARVENSAPQLRSIEELAALGSNTAEENTPIMIGTK